MKVLVVGGGPAGLYFSYLLKKRCPHHDIQVVEQNPRGATYGWGVVFSGVALGVLREADAEFFAEFAAGQETCDYIQVVHRNQAVRVHGNHFSRTPRLDLLRKLEQACERVGVTLNYEQKLEPSAVGAEWDLVACADGINSTFREHFSIAFGTKIATRRNYFAWYGTRALFHPVSLIFAQTAWGTFISHCYQYSATHSTFLVECSPETWRRAGLDRMSDEDSRAFCARTFRNELNGEPLLSNRSLWFTASIVSNERASHDRFVLVGDAYRTVHFSLGSGTRMAMQDAMALCDAVVSTGDDARGALAAYEGTRRPASAEFQKAAARSLDWYETVDERMSLSPLAFTYDYMTRTGKVAREDLLKMDPTFVKAFDREARTVSAALEGRQ